MSESAAGSDLKGFKANLLQKVIPKTIVKEQHAGAVRALQFNHLPGGGPTPGRAGGAAAGSTACGNLFATVGGSFATVYDDEHFGDHVAVVVQFHNDATPYTSGGELTALCWVDGLGFSLHEFGDALLAVGGGDDHAVQVISVTEGRVVKLLKGHGGGILALASGSSAPTAAAAAPPRPELLVSLSLDGTLKRRRGVVVTVPTLLFGKAILWNWRTEERLCTYQAHDAVSVAVKPDGSGMYTGHKDGKVREWTFPGGRGAGAVGSPAGGGGGARKRPNPDELTAADAGAVVVPIEHHAGVPVDCIRILPGVGGGDGNDDGESAASGNHRVATKSMDGAIHVYDAAARRGVGSWRVPGVKAPKPGAEPGALAERLTSFNADPRGEFIAVGNDDGEVMVFDVATGGVVTAVEQERDFKALNAVRAAAVSADCRHVHACFGPGIVWRAEVVPGTEGEEEREGEGGPGTPPGETLVPAV